MRTLIAFLLLLFFTISVNAQCKWDKKHGKDPFTGTISRATTWETMKSTIWGSVGFRIIEYPQDSLLLLSVNVNTNANYSSPECFNDESKIMIKSGETIITINLLGGTDCGYILVNHGELLPEDIEFLKHNPIEMIRIEFAEGYEDYKNLVKSKSDYFVRTLKCFE